MIIRFVWLAILVTLAACGAEEQTPAELRDSEPHLVIASAREHVYADRSEDHGSGQVGYAWTLVGEGVGHFEATLHRIADGNRDSVVVRGESISDDSLTREVSVVFTDGMVVGKAGRIHAALAVAREKGSATSVDWGGPQEIETPYGVGTRWRRTGDAIPPDDEWVVLILGIEEAGSSGTPLPIPVTLAGLTAHSSEGRTLLVVTVRWKENP